MRRVKTEHTVAHQRRRLDRSYFREWDRLEYLLERSLGIEASSLVRQHELTIMLDHAALAGWLVEPAIELGFDGLVRHKFVLSKGAGMFFVLLAHAPFLPSFHEGFSVRRCLGGVSSCNSSNSSLSHPEP